MRSHETGSSISETTPRLAVSAFLSPSGDNVLFQMGRRLLHMLQPCLASLKSIHRIYVNVCFSRRESKSVIWIKERRRVTGLP